MSMQTLADWNLGHMDILHHGPNDRQTAGLRCEGIDLVGSLPNIAKETFNGIGGANIAMHHLWKGVKGQEMLFIFHQAADGFWISFLVFGFEGCSIEQRVVFFLLFPDSCEFGAHLLALAMRNRVHHIALLMHESALAQRRGKEGRDGCEESIMPIGDKEIDFSDSTGAEIL